MPLVDFDKLAKEYANVGDEFGLSFVSKSYEWLEWKKILEIMIQDI